MIITSYNMLICPRCSGTLRVKPLVFESGSPSMVYQPRTATCERCGNTVRMRGGTMTDCADLSTSAEKAIIAASQGSIDRAAAIQCAETIVEAVRSMVVDRIIRNLGGIIEVDLARTGGEDFSVLVSASMDVKPAVMMETSIGMESRSPSQRKYRVVQSSLPAIKSDGTMTSVEQPTDPTASESSHDRDAEQYYTPMSPMSATSHTFAAYEAAVQSGGNMVDIRTPSVWRREPAPVRPGSYQPQAAEMPTSMMRARNILDSLPVVDSSPVRAAAFQQVVDDIAVRHCRSVANNIADIESTTNTRYQF